MKSLNIFSLAILMSILGFLSSCDDIVTYNDGYDDGMTSTGSPEINAVYRIDDESHENPISEGAFEDMIVLVGTNLSGVHEILLNDVQIDLKEVYATSTSVYFSIPKTVPGVFTNKISYETELGRTTFDFKVLIPDLQIEGLFNEFALPGTSVQVIGKFFDLYGFGGGNESSSIKMNGEELEVDSLTEDFMSIKIPADASDNSNIEFSWTGNDGETTYSIPYRQSNSIVWDLNNPGDYGFWAGTQYITDGSETGAPEALFGPYFRVNGSFASYSWNTLPCGGFNMPDEIASNPADYLLKFEVNSAAGTPFYSSGTAGYLIKINSGSYAWNPSSESSFNTYGNWETVSLELADVATKGLKSGWITMNWIMQPNSAWIVDHSFANIRIERKVD